MRSPPFLKPTREPARADTSTPTATNKASTTAPLMSDGVGLVKMRSKVRRCLIPMPI